MTAGNLPSAPTIDIGASRPHEGTRRLLKQRQYTRLDCRFYGPDHPRGGHFALGKHDHGGGGRLFSRQQQQHPCAARLARRPSSFPTLVGILAASLLWGAAAHAANVDVAIVFAVDFSSSIDPKTADMQREGHAAALTSPEIISVISRNYFGCISVAYFEWSSPGHARNVLPWTSICGLEDAKAAASVISKRGDTGHIRRGRSGTSVSSAIDIGALLLDQFPGKAAKKVIDISSNGENNDGLPVQPSRQNAIAKGYTINAIAIPTDDENPGQPLAAYFAESVIGGSQAFVITSKGPSDYATALRRKLVTEVSMNVDPRSPPQADGANSLSALSGKPSFDNGIAPW